MNLSTTVSIFFSSADLPQDQTEGTLSGKNTKEGKENNGKPLSVCTYHFNFLKHLTPRNLYTVTWLVLKTAIQQTQLHKKWV